MKDLSLEQLENDFWGEPEFNSYVVQTAHNARKKPLSQLSNEEIRLLIGQKIGLKHLLPIAVGKLKENILLEASLYSGDLLKNILSLNKDDWNGNQSALEQLTEIILNNKKRLLSTDEISDTLVEKFIGYTKQRKQNYDLKRTSRNNRQYACCCRCGEPSFRHGLSFSGYSPR